MININVFIFVKQRLIKHTCLYVRNDKYESHYVCKTAFDKHTCPCFRNNKYECLYVRKTAFKKHICLHVCSNNYTYLYVCKTAFEDKCLFLLYARKSVFVILYVYVCIQNAKYPHKQLSSKISTKAVLQT